jgi:hypothetical protein
MKLIQALGAVLIAAACGQAPTQQAAAAQETLPPEVVAAMQQEDSDCTALGGELTRADEALKRGDFNGDGSGDYLLDQNHISCSTDMSYFCGSLGCGITAFVSQPDGSYRPGLDLVAPQVSVVRDGDRDAVDVAADDGSIRWSYANGEWTAPGVRTDR